MQKNKLSNVFSSNSKYKFIWSLLFSWVLIAGTDVYFAEHDTWFLFNHGRYILNNGFPVVEPFTMHENLDFMIPQWLSSVVLWLTYSWFGRAGIYLLNIIMLAITTVLFYRLSLFVSNKNYNLSRILSLIFIILISKNYAGRPYIFTNLIFLSELCILELYYRKNNSKYLLALPVLSLILINFSSAMWLMFFVLMLPFVAESILAKFKKIKCDKSNISHLLAVSIISFLVGFINPYGFKGITYLFRSFGHYEINKYVQEMQPPSIGNSGAFPLVIIVAAALIYIFYRKGTSKVRYFFLSAGCCLLEFIAIRNISFLAMGILLPLAFYLKDFNPNLSLNENKNNKRFLNFLCVLLSSITVILSVTTVIDYQTLDAAEKEPQKAIAAILENSNPENAKIYCIMDHGSYLEYLGFKVYSDTRMEVLVKETNNKKDIFEEWDLLQTGKLYYKEFLNRYNFTHLLVNKEDILFTYLNEDSGYKKIYEDEDYRVFVPVSE